MFTHPYRILVPLCIAAAVLPASAQTSCLAKYQGKPSEVLTPAFVGKVIDLSGKETTASAHDARNPRFASASLNWPSDRKLVKDLGFTKVEVPQDNTVTLGGPAVVNPEKDRVANAREYIERNYRSISAEEMAEMQKAMKAALEERVAKGEITREQADLAAGIGGGLAGKERIVESIDNLGDGARWIANDLELVVAHRDTWFRVQVNVSEDVAVNRDSAIAVAKAVLALCD